MATRTVKGGTKKETIEQEVARLRAENEALLARAAESETTLTLKVSGKGAVSVYGLGRFPVTLYQEQWTKLIAIAPDIEQFIRDNASALKRKEAR